MRWMMVLAGLLSAASHLYGDPVIGNGGYSSSFNDEDGLDWTTTGLWAVDATPSDMPGGIHAPGNLGERRSGSLNYNNRVRNYETGGPNRGEAASPVINLHHMDSPVLTFACNYESENEGFYDLRKLHLRRRDGTSVRTIQFRTNSIVQPNILNCGSTGTWHTHTVPLDRAWGFIKLVFEFDTVDHYNNHMKGWCVDELRVQGQARIERYRTTFAEAAGWQFSGLWNVDASPQSVPGGAAHGTGTSLNYNDGVDYDLGNVRTLGTAISPTINVARCERGEITFWCNYVTHDPSTSSDYRIVWIYRAADQSILAGHMLSTSVGSGPTFCPQMGYWHKHVIPLTSAMIQVAQTIKIGFTFDSVDGRDNGHPGWFVDNLDVTVVPNLETTLDQFDAYANVFSANQGWTTTGMWRFGGPATAAPPVPAGSPPSAGAENGAVYSNPGSLQYSNGLNYDHGGLRTTGDALSPVIDLEFHQRPSLTFKCNYQTETVSGYDLRIVRVLSAQGTLLAHYWMDGRGGSPELGPCAAMGLWHEHRLALDPAWGKVRVAFRFDSVDGFDNGYAGWFVDDLYFDRPDVMNIRSKMVGGLTVEGTGAARKLRFATALGNAGYGALTAPQEAFYFDEDHQHHHFRDMTEYRLRSLSGPEAAPGTKVGFYWISHEKIRSLAPAVFPQFAPGLLIKPGYLDLYGATLPGQELNIGTLPDGEYRLEYVLDPLDRIHEADELNNTDGGLVIRLSGATVTVVSEKNP